MIKLLKTKVVQVLFVTAVISGIGFFAHKATNKENVQTNQQDIPVIIQKGAHVGTLIVKVGSPQQITEDDNLSISLNGGVEYNNDSGFTYVIGVSKSF